METLTLNIPTTNQKRIVVIGAGFGGLTLTKALKNSPYQVVLIDKNNYHQFQPLLYQVAMAGLEPSSISFPLRKSFQKSKNVFIRIAEMESVDPSSKTVYTSQGQLTYDYLVLSTGAKTNFFGNKKLEQNCYVLKSVRDALDLRNSILSDFENALQTRSYDKRQSYVDIVIVGGGPTGVELAGALAEMKMYILPKDYPEFDHREMDIYLIQSGDKLLKGMHEKLGRVAKERLEQMGVQVVLNDRVIDVEHDTVKTKNGREILAKKVIWAAGVSCEKVKGLDSETNVQSRSNRFLVNAYSELVEYPDIYAIGDAACMISEHYPYGHAQVAQPAIQQGAHLARNFKRLDKQKSLKPFVYRDKGTMATIGRNKAVVQLKWISFTGYFAWLAWLFVHLAALVGARNKAIVLLNWFWNYWTYDQSLRLVIQSENKKKVTD